MWRRRRVNSRGGNDTANEIFHVPAPARQPLTHAHAIPPGRAKMAAHWPPLFFLWAPVRSSHVGAAL